MIQFESKCDLGLDLYKVLELLLLLLLLLLSSSSSSSTTLS